MKFCAGSDGTNFRWWWSAMGVVVVGLENICRILFNTYVGA